MASTSKGVYWTDSEIEYMLKALHRIGAGRKVMTSTNVETTTLFQQVSDKMKEQGYNRTASQIRSKFKKEKGFFYDAMEAHGGIPEKQHWGPRFGLLRHLWVQADKPDFRLRRPAASGKSRKHQADHSSHSDEEEPSTAARRECRAVPTGLDSQPGSPSSIQGRTNPTYEELVQEVRSQNLEIARLKRLVEFLRQGIDRIKRQWEHWKLEYALRVQQQESNSSDAPTEEEGNEDDEDEGMEFVDVRMVVLDSSNDSEGPEREVTVVTEEKLDNKEEGTETEVAEELVGEDTRL